MFNLLLSALTARAEAYRMIFELPTGLVTLPNREANQLLRDADARPQGQDDRCPGARGSLA
ncbi:MAG: hypothetical protein AAFY02_06015 [Pseudomonadota bacterium]